MARLHTQIKASDPFEELASGQELDVDDSWEAVYEDGSYIESSSLTRIYAWVGGRCVYKFVDYEPASADYTVGAKYDGFEGDDSDFYIGVAGRLDDSGPSYDLYDLLYFHDTDGTDKLRIYRINNNVLTLLAETSKTLSQNDWIYLEVVGTGATVTLKGYVNDTEEINCEDSSADRITVKGRGGLYAYKGGGSTYPYWEEWRLYEAAAGGRAARLLGPLGGRGQIGFGLAA